MREYTRELCHHLMGMTGEAIGAHALASTMLAVQDFIGVSIAGSEKPESAIWRRYYRNKPSAPAATVWGGGYEKVGVDQAAARNAAAGHVMDLDDTHNASIAHLAAVTVPTALALGESLHSSGRAVLEAVAAGYEAGAKIGECINPEAYHFWHTTAVVGSFAAATVAARLLGLTEEELVHAFGSAGTQAAGLWEFLATGAMSKVLHTANANLCGLRAAELAQLGFTGAPGILEGERGFVRALTTAPHWERLVDFSMGPEIARNSLKAYACCRHTHAANDCLQGILRGERLDPASILSIEDRTYRTAISTTDNPRPATPYAAKFSLQFCLSALVVWGRLDDGVFTDANLHDERILTLMPKIRISPDEEIERAFHCDPNRWPHALTITLSDGRTLSGRVDYPLGDFNNAFNQPMEDDKFDRLVRKVDPVRAPILQKRLHTLADLSDVSTLFDFREEQCEHE